MKKEKILVAMSGGVDSSVVAALLVKQGYDVTGAYMKQWSDTKDVSGLCQWKKDRRDAMRVAAHLGIPLLTLDFEKEYKEWVMGYMFAEYEVGRTPNPDVMCNKFIKFDAWLGTVRKMGFDKMATGHYAAIKKTKNQENKKAMYQLAQAVDDDKDQTYFLHQLTQEQLSYTMFPLGEYTKSEVREMARKFDLPTAEREESMGICFVGEMPMKEFLQQKIKKHPGKIVTEDGTVVGEHEGLSFYTIGQRHVGQLAMNNKQVTNQAPMFVVEKRFDTNELVVGFVESPLLYKTEITVDDMHWISGHQPSFPLDCKVRLRHRQEMQNVEVHIEHGEVTLLFDMKQRAVTPGQFAVLYKDGICLGGGVIT
ncbi:MAG: tRNA 2-thiouridine(34) synthase MnmA [Candidatus Magasanikbacteria bacterium CG_4_9_14_0_2_um_filter_42_11]|uniref:tRNA-specific 2-thiouridylase MnmA n=1 Tax=Candidatus Magasanikbacteria bacterium CG_4_9_14_0_2_um_filter_42_11 TaxID=1974643 RepID=A0A2M8FA59_9BACT|nr:MAG: tRNA 2-thiouridine(34) synthase MnmA [Candidatus Magasanikbacteria bacterium CG10_big_fil_rev_8_21_14_0_10_43_9]PIY93055.1 MAG: tRNA 2-thiouridine(34) synthase MnmA [Candidatus Magasanikbacteria bacterium CG_4_10_14_0_8_um_filter_42_12]PJC52612.1 MAG: tRNA 2-thiouridine(34) synthase MnmA [Candidatus Magasanikbacteria bacterium CG_4_9_14_0_2_um_filter_42_11]